MDVIGQVAVALGADRVEDSRSGTWGKHQRSVRSIEWRRFRFADRVDRALVFRDYGGSAARTITFPSFSANARTEPQLGVTNFLVRQLWPRDEKPRNSQCICWLDPNVDSSAISAVITVGFRKGCACDALIDEGSSQSGVTAMTPVFLWP